MAMWAAGVDVFKKAELFEEVRREQSSDEKDKQGIDFNFMKRTLLKLRSCPS